MAASTRYYWRVEVWDKDGKPYPASDVSWWETGLLKEPWKAQWIGYEDPEHRAVRKSGATWITNADGMAKNGADTQHDFRFKFQLNGPVKHADLFVTGEDSAAAWVNGKQVLEAVPLPPWKQAPWKTYLLKDVTANVRSGENLLAVGVTLYGTPSPTGMVAPETNQTPMSACLYVEMTDGSVVVFASNKEWKARLDADQGWYDPKYDDARLVECGRLRTTQDTNEREHVGKSVAHRAGETASPQLRSQRAHYLCAPLCNRLRRLSRADQRRAGR